MQSIIFFKANQWDYISKKGDKKKLTTETKAVLYYEFKNR